MAYRECSYYYYLLPVWIKWYGIIQIHGCSDNTFNLQVYKRLNHVGVCMSYSAVLQLVENISLLHAVPLEQWISDGTIFKFWGDNVDKKKQVRDVRSDNQGKMVHMYSLLVGCSRVPGTSLSCTGKLQSCHQCSLHHFCQIRMMCTA